MKKLCFFLTMMAMLFGRNHVINSMFKRVVPSAIRNALAFRVAPKIVPQVVSLSSDYQSSRSASIVQAPSLSIIKSPDKDVLSSADVLQDQKLSDKNGESKSSGSKWYKGKWQRLSVPIAASIVAAGVCGFTHNCIGNAAEIEDVNNEFLNAVKANDKVTINRLLSKVNKVDEALAIAVLRRDVDLAALLVPMAKYVDCQLVIAIERGYGEIVDILLPMAKNVDKVLDEAITQVKFATNYYDQYNRQNIFIKIFLKANKIVNKKIAAGETVEESSMQHIIDAVSFCSSLGAFQSLLSNGQTKDLAFYFVTFAHQDWLYELLKPKERIDDTKTATELLLEKYMILDKKDTLKRVCSVSGIDNCCYSIGDLGDLSALLRQVIAVEKEDQRQGYTTFVHGRHWGWNFVNDAWNMIRAVRDDKDTISSDISMRQRDVDCNVEGLLKYRKKLVLEGTTGEHLLSSTTDNFQERAEVTFMNYTGLSHVDSIGESSILYSLLNNSIITAADPCEIVKKLLCKNGLEKYLEEFVQLYHMHKKSNKRGELLTISINNYRVDSIVYPALPGGYLFYDRFLRDLVDDFEQMVQKAVEQNAPSKMRDQYPRNSYGATSRTIARCNQKIVKDPLCFQKMWDSKMYDKNPIFCAAALTVPGEGQDVCKIRSLHLADDGKYKEYLAARQRLFEKLKKEKVA